MRGMVAIAVDYRVYTRNGAKAYQCVQDAKSAMRWVRSNADRLGIDPNRIVAAGGSAVGYKVTTLDLCPPADIVGDINDWENLGIQAGSFDVIIALEVIEHVDCLDALCDLCKPEGLVLLSSPHPKWDWVMKCFEAIGFNLAPHLRTQQPDGF